MARHITIHFDEVSYKNLEQMEADLEKGSKSAVIRQALMLLRHAKEIQQSGGKLILKEKDGVEREVLLV